jgi:hypothetical protein
MEGTEVSDKSIPDMVHEYQHLHMQRLASFYAKYKGSDK